MSAARGRAIGIGVAIAVVVVGLLVWFLRGHDDAPIGAGSGSGLHAPAPPVSPQRARIAALLHPELGAIDGTVGEGGRPVAGAVACARATDADLDDARCAIADATGAFALPDLPPASYFVWASADGLATAHAIAPVAVAPGQRTAVALVLARGGAVVAGLVRDVRKQPIAGATVQLGTGRDDIAATATTAADGTFTATVGPAGDVSIYAAARGFVDADASATAPATGIVLEMTPEATLAGTVVSSASHEPVPDATVSAGGEHATTDASGRFEIGKLSPGRYKPTATAVGGYGEAAESVRVTLGQRATGLVIELHPVAAVIGQIVIGSAAPARACPPGAGEIFLSRYGSSQAYRTRTIADGTVILEGVVGGTYEVSVSCKGFLPALPYADLAIGDSDLPDQLWRVAEGARVVGTVVEAGGRAPVAGAYVNHIDSGGLLAGTVKTDERGAFAIEGVAPGIVALSAGADGFAHDDAKTRVTATTSGAPASATLVLHRGGTLTGSVVDAAGAPVAGANVRSDGDGNDGGSAHSDARGEFTMSALAPGEYGVYVQSDWSDLASASRVTATVTLDRPARVRLVVPAAPGTLAGVVVDERGAPVTDAYVDTAKVDRDATRPSFHDPAALTALDGSFAFAGLPPGGTFLVRARRLGGGEVATPVPVAVGATGVRLVLGATGVLAGVVTTPDGAPVDDATIGAADRPHDREREERLFHTGGRFALRELPPGTYQVRVDDDPRSAMTVTLGDGEQRTDLHLVAQVRYTVRGRLVDEGGRPLAGWKIEAPRLELEEATGTRSISVATIEGAITDGDGRFLVRNMPSGPLDITCADVVHDPDAKTRAVTTAALAGANPLVDLGDLHPGAPTE